MEMHGDDETVMTDAKEKVESGSCEGQNVHVPEDGTGDGVDPMEKEWIFILGHERLRKKVIKDGKGIVTRPTHGQKVTISLEGKLENGVVVDKHSSLAFTMGDGDVIQALDLAVALMETGEVTELYSDAEYAYGPSGRDPDIPADANITYQVELLDVEDPPVISQMPISERVSLGDTKRDRGNYHFGRKDFSSAINSYNRALVFLTLEGTSGDDSEAADQLTNTRLKCFNNVAAAQLKVEAWDACISSCDEVLKIDQNNAKAMFRKGKALACKGDLEDAIACLRLALKADPEAKIIHKELSYWISKRNASLKSQKEMYQRMLGGDSSSRADKSSRGWSQWKVITTGAVVASILSVGIAMYRSLHV